MFSGATERVGCYPAQRRSARDCIMRNSRFFAHYNPNDKVDEYVLCYLKHFKELNFSIVFISTALLPAGQVERLRSECFDVILRDNIRLDFGSWPAGFAKHNGVIRRCASGSSIWRSDSIVCYVARLSRKQPEAECDRPAA